jgi:hypothetical protein
MTKIIANKIFLIFILTSFTILAQDADREVAKVGNISISSSEFQSRFELTPRLGPQNKENLESSKKDFLSTLIAEKLWALKAHDLKMDTLEIIKSAMDILEGMYVRDALFKIEVTDKVEIPAKDIISATFKNQVKLKVNYLYSPDKEKIYNLYNLLNNGLSFDSLLTGKDSTIEITFGKMVEPIEDSLYNTPIGKYTAPLQGPAGDWFIFRIKSRENNISVEEDIEKATKNVKEIVKNRITSRVYNEYFNNFFKGRKIFAKGSLFLSIADKIIKIINEKKKKENIPSNGKIYLSENDVGVIKKDFGRDSLKLNFINFENDPVSLENFLNDMAFEGFYVTGSDSSVIKSALNSKIKTYIEHELLTREGYNRGLQNLPEVKSELKIWNDYYLAQVFKRKFLDSIKITNSEVSDYYNKKNKEMLIPKQVNIIEILTDDLEVIEKVLDELKNGADMRQLAKKYPHRKWTKDGEFGFFSISEHGEIGKIAGKMKVGEVYGPLKVPEGYSIFKLIDEKDEKKQEPISFENVKDDIRKNLMASKLEKYAINYTGKLADEYGVTIDENVLKQLKVTYIVMYAYRYLGFGGRIIAIPMTPPFSEWYNPWLKSKKELP